MTTDPEPLSVGTLDELAAFVDKETRGNHLSRSIGGAILSRIDRIRATTDEARATPSGDRLSADVIERLNAQADDLERNGDWHDAILATDIRAALRSVSADSTAGLDVERLRKALIAVNGYIGSGNADSVAREYAALSDTPGDTDA